MCEIKTEDVYEDLIIIGTKAKFYHEANKLVIGKMKDETGGVAIK